MEKNKLQSDLQTKINNKKVSNNAKVEVYALRYLETLINSMSKFQTVERINYLT